MSILNEAINEEVEMNAEQAAPTPAEEYTGTEQPQPASFGIDLSFLRTPTGPGAIDDYIEHPFNNDGSRGTAQILRGLTGIAGNLNFAIADIILGAINLYKERKTNGANI